MRMIFGLVLIVGVGLAGFAVFMAKNYIGAYQAELAKERAVSAKAIKTVGVYVMNKSVKYGEQLSVEDLQIIQWPDKAVPEGAFTKKRPPFEEGEDRPRYVLRAMEKYEPLMALKVTAPGEDAGLTSRLGKGMRAFAIRVDVASGVSGFLRTGDRVDIYWTGRAPVSGSNTRSTDVTRLIESNVNLIAIDQTAATEISGASIASTVTVAATPQQVAALAQAQATGRLSLSLVGAGDETVADVIEVDQRKLLGISEGAQQVAVAPQKQVCTTRVNKGTEKIEIQIPCTN